MIINKLFLFRLNLNKVLFLSKKLDNYNEQNNNFNFCVIVSLL